MSNLSRHDLERKVQQQKLKAKRKLRILKLADKLFTAYNTGGMHSATYGGCIEEAEKIEETKELYLNNGE